MKSTLHLYIHIYFHPTRPGRVVSSHFPISSQFTLTDLSLLARSPAAQIHDLSERIISLLSNIITVTIHECSAVIGAGDARNRSDIGVIGAGGRSRRETAAAVMDGPDTGLQSLAVGVAVDDGDRRCCPYSVQICHSEAAVCISVCICVFNCVCN